LQYQIVDTCQMAAVHHHFVELYRRQFGGGKVDRTTNFIGIEAEDLIRSETQQQLRMLSQIDVGQKAQGLKLPEDFPASGVIRYSFPIDYGADRLGREVKCARPAASGNVGEKQRPLILCAFSRRRLQNLSNFLMTVVEEISA